MEDNVKSFLEKIKELKEQTVKVYVGSLKKEVDSLHLSFKQQKDLIGTIGDGNLGALKFQKVLNLAVLDNVGNDTLLVTDKLPVIIKLRSESIGNLVKRDDIDINLEDVLKNLKNIKYPKSKTIKGNITIELQIPTIKEETKVIQTALESLKQDETDIGKSIGNIYTYEIVKYINKIKFGEDELLFSAIPVKDRFKVVDNLPLSTNKEIIEFIQDIKVKESEALEYNVNGETKVLEIDVSFFDS
jgi:hypothetical protein